MGVKPDRWIRRMAAEQGLIEPFEPDQVRERNGRRVISYGTSSYGYDIRCADEFKVFTNINSAIVDPKSFDDTSFVDVRSDVCIIPPNSFALARTVEYLRIPRRILTICPRQVDLRALRDHRQRDPARTGMGGARDARVSPTPPRFPPGFYANEGVAQVIFLESDEGLRDLLPGSREGSTCDNRA